MRVAFYELPQALRVGGLETACRGLEGALAAQGVEVLRDPAPAELRPGDVAHFHGLWSLKHLGISRQLAKMGIPWVSSPHGMLEPWAIREKRWKKLPYFWLLEKSRLTAGTVLATADQEAERLRKRLGPQAKVEVILLGSDMVVEPDYAAARKELGWSDGERVLLYLSRIHKKKGLLQLLETLARLDPRLLAKARLVVVGDGPQDYVDACKAAARKLDGKLKIDWHDPIWGDGKWRYLQGADLMCLPTFSENFGMVVLEACQVGTPVLTTIETPWKVIADADYGWVGPAEPAFYQEALVDFLQRAPDSLPDRNKLAEWTRERFSWEMLSHEYLALYRSLSKEKELQVR